MGILRLGDKKAEVRDILHLGPAWDQNLGAQDARKKFRETLIKTVPDAVVAGDAGRVYAPVQGLSEQRDAVVKAISELAEDLRLSNHVNGPSGGYPEAQQRD